MAGTFKIGFLGAGKMASALAKGFVASKLVSPKQIIASDVMEPARAAFEKDVGATGADSNAEVLQFATVLVLAVKPGQVAAVLNEIKQVFTAMQVMI